MTNTPVNDRQLNTKRGKTNNAGFSLVELLIAVTILAIIVIPLLHMFVTSTRINVKSRQTLRATTVAQDIMEGLKAYTLDEVRTQFTLPDGTISTDYFYPTEGFYIVNSSMIQDGVREIIELEPWLDGDGNVITPNAPNNEIYYFGIKNLKMQGGEYDALIKLDASTYMKAKAGDTTHDPDATHDSVFNGTFYAQTNSVSETSGDSGKDSSYHEHSELTAYALEVIKKDIEEAANESGNTLPGDWEAKELKDFHITRTINVTFDDAHSTEDGYPECLATITFKYECQYDIDGNGTISSVKSLIDPNKDISETFVSYGKAGSVATEVKGITRTFSSGNFYLFYYPIYESSVEDNVEFTINNAATLFKKEQPLLKSVTLAKQIRSFVDPTNNIIIPEMSDSELYGKEIGYTPTVRMDIDTPDSMETDLRFRTNIDINLSPLAVTDDPSDRELENITYLGAFNNPSAKIKQNDLTGENVSNKVTDVIYDVEITVYKTGAAQYFSDPNFEVTHSDEVQRLATITNLN